MAPATPPPSSDPTALAVLLSCVWLGADARAQRLVKEMTSGQAPGTACVDDLLTRLGIPANARPPFIAAARARAASAMQRARAQRIESMPYFDNGYPAALSQIADPPILLWIRGDPSCLAGPAIAIVGSRRATPTGLDVARKLAADLAARGFVIVSGMARGVDGAAHLGALDAGGRTIAVLGCGPDVVYPHEHDALAERIVRTGAIVSELPPGVPPLPHHFPLRNRIISGLARAVIVIEASDKSGSLITARAALDQNRDVLAVPGSVVSGRSRGCHALIKDGARLVETVEDVLQELGWREVAARPDSNSKSFELSDLEQKMALGETYSIEDLAGLTGLGTSALLAELGTLELAGRVRRAAGGGFVRLDEPVTNS